MALERGAALRTGIVNSPIPPLTSNKVVAAAAPAITAVALKPQP